MPHRVIARRVGLRGELMLILGVIWILVGIGVVTVDPPHTPSVWHELLPMPLRVGGWVVTGLLAIAGALTAPLWPQWSDRAIGLLTIMPLQRVVSYLWSWVMHLWPDPPAGDPDGWYRALYYVLGVLLVWVAARIPAGPWPGGVIEQRRNLWERATREGGGQ